jgi:F420H(2)-dependent quinone reductase
MGLTSGVIGDCTSPSIIEPDSEQPDTGVLDMLASANVSLGTMATKRNAIVELFWKVHPWLYRWSGGRIGGRIMNLPVLLLTTTGRRSRTPRTKALMYLPKGNSYVVIASYLGEPRHPAWWLNLQVDPTAEIQVGSRRLTVVAREADGDERERLWKEIVERQSDYAEYQQRTERRIPVVVLDTSPTAAS